MHAYRFCLSAVAAITMLSACGGGSDSDTPPDNSPPTILNVTKVDGRYHSNKTATATDLKSSAAFYASHAGHIVLPALSVEDLVLKSSAVGGALQAAQGQKVAQAATTELTAQQLQWATDASGNTTGALRITATNAYGLRLGLVVDALPDNATVRIFTEGDASTNTGYEVSGAAINTLIQQNTAAGDTSSAARTWWSADLGGDTVVLQIVLPSGVDSSAVQVALPTVSNIFRDTSEYTYALDTAESSAAALQSLAFTSIDAKNEIVPVAGSCNLDVSCFSNGAQQRDAVARMLFTEADGKSYWCTGTLLNDAIQSNTPYFLTANHCINSQTVASTLQTDWFFRTASCNGNTLNANRTARTGGARLLFSNNLEQGNDMTLLALNDAAPTGTFLAGWDANQNNTQQNVLSIHHPRGSLAKISGGQTVTYANCSDDRCVTSPTGRFYWVEWTQGVSEGGSSGSALINNNGHVIGTLLGGSSSCTAQGDPDFYGRFDQAFQLGIRNFLAASKRPF